VSFIYEIGLEEGCDENIEAGGCRCFYEQFTELFRLLSRKNREVPFYLDFLVCCGYFARYSL